MTATFRQAYALWRENIIYDCKKHSLHLDPEVFADCEINKLTTTEVFEKLETFAQIVEDKQ